MKRSMASYAKFKEMLPTSRVRPILLAGPTKQPDEPEGERPGWNEHTNFVTSAAGYYEPAIFGSYAYVPCQVEWVSSNLYFVPFEHLSIGDVDSLYGEATGAGAGTNGLSAEGVIRSAISKGKVDTRYAWVPDPNHWCRVVCVVLAKMSSRRGEVKRVVNDALDEM